MGDTAFSEYQSADEGNAPLQPRARTRPRTKLLAETPPEVEQQQYDEYDYEDEAPSGLFSTPARTITVVFSMLLILAVGVAIAWQLGSASGGGGTGASNQSTTQGTGPRTGLLAPNFSLVDVKTNKAVSLDSLRGEPVWINFWGTWCPPCKAEMPEMEKLYQQYKGKVHMIGISMGPRDDVANVKQFVDLNGYHWQFIHDPDSSVMYNYQVTGIPSSFFIDKDGVIRSVAVGGATAPQLESHLKLALNAQ